MRLCSPHQPQIWISFITASPLSLPASSRRRRRRAVSGPRAIGGCMPFQISSCLCDSLARVDADSASQAQIFHPRPAFSPLAPAHNVLLPNLAIRLTLKHDGVCFAARRLVQPFAGGKGD